jgi:hypothetical protein
MNETFLSSMGFKLLLLVTAGVSVATMGVAASKATESFGKSKIPKTGLEIPQPTGTVVAESGSVDLKLIEEVKTKKTEGKCVITLFSKQYDVTEVNKTGGSTDIFDCGEDMSSQYSAKYGKDVSRMEKYLVGGTPTTTENTPTAMPTNGATITAMPTAQPIKSGRDDSREFEDDNNEREDSEHTDRYEKKESESEEIEVKSESRELESKDN